MSMLEIYNDSVVLPPESTLEIVVPVEVQNGSNPYGEFPASNIIIAGETITLTKGFRVEFDDVGSLEPIANKVGVIYTHKKPAANRVFFHAANGKFAVVSIVNVPVHTHQSIVQGGPAHGTYFRDRTTT